MIETLVDSFDIWGTAQTQKSLGKKPGIDNLSLHGINRLRELILELAIRGRIVEQDPEDESANKLLERCQNEKNKQIESGSLKRYNKENTGLVDNEKPFKIPKTWEWAWFSDLYYFQEGPGIRNWQFRTEGIKLLNVQNIVDGQLILDNTDKYIDEQEYSEKYQHFTIQENDLLFASSGGSWGKTAFFYDPGYKVIVNTSTIRIFPYDKGFSYSFMRNIVDSSFFKAQMEEQLVGMQPNFGSTHLLKIFMPVPPLNEQFRIGDKVNELMALCDKLEKEQMNRIETHLKLVEALLQTLTNATNAKELKAAWQHLEPHFDILFTTEESIDLLKQTILQLAVMGKLVPQNPNDEPASVLLKKIEAEKNKLIKAGKLKKQKPLPEITEDEKPFELPKGWEFVRLGNIITISSGDGLTAAQMNKEGEIPVFGGNGINGYHDTWNVNKETLVIGRVGYYCGSIHITPNRAWITDNAFITYFSESNIELDFMYWLLTGTNLKENENATAQPVISGRKIYPIVVGLPPLKEQELIVARLQELMTLCDQLKEQIVASQQLKVKLADAVVERAVN